jgi:Ni/Co efflux regulator RcnB
MKKIVAILTAMAFALTLGVAFAEDQPAPAAGGEQKMEKKEMKEKKKKKTAKKKAHKKEKKEMKKEEAAPEYK